MKNYPAVGTQIELTNLVTRESASARITELAEARKGAHRCRRRTDGSSETFWAEFQLKKICADLVRVEYEMRSGTVDERVLRDFAML